MSDHRVDPDSSADFVIQPFPSGSGFEVRRSGEAAIEDPFVGIYTFDNPDCGHPYTELVTGGVERYVNYAEYGRNATTNVGGRARIEIKTALLDEDRKVELAKRLAAIAFDLAGEQTT